MHVQNFKAHARTPEARHQHRTHDTEKQQEVHGAFHFEGFMRLRRTHAGIFLTVGNRIDDKIDRNQEKRCAHHGQEQMLSRPEEVNATQKAQEQRRIAQRSEAAADIGNKEDKEDEGVHLKATLFIGRKQRTNQKHCGTRGTHQVGKQRAHKQNSAVDSGRTMEGWLDVNAAGHHKQSPHENNEGNVITDDGVSHSTRSRRCTVD